MDLVISISNTAVMLFIKYSSRRFKVFITLYSSRRFNLRYLLLWITNHIRSLISSTKTVFESVCNCIS